MILDKFKKKAVIVRIVLHLLVIRNTMPLYELKSIEDFQIEESYINTYSTAIAIIILLLCVCLSERLAVAGPLNILYCLFLVIGVSVWLSYFQDNKIENSL